MKTRAIRTTKKTQKSVFTIDRGHGCSLFCFGTDYPLEIALMVILESLQHARALSAGTPEWIVAAGDSPLHWRGLTQWVLVSDTIPVAALDGVRQDLDESECYPDYESTEMTTIGREAFATPRFSLGDDGVCLLVTPDQFDADWRNTLLGIELKQRAYQLTD